MNVNNMHGERIKTHKIMFANVILVFMYLNGLDWAQSPRGLRRRSAAARLLRMWVRIPPGAWMFVVSVVCCQAGFCDGLITRPEESYQLWYVVICDL